MTLPDAGPRYVMKRIKSDAKAAVREFSLTLDNVKDLIHLPCYYCGALNKNKMNVKSMKPGEFIVKDFCYNGIDRVDNSLGYILSNCVPCCMICNRAKNNLSEDEFFAWIENITGFRNGIRIQLQGRASQAGKNHPVQELLW